MKTQSKDIIKAFNKLLGILCILLVPLCVGFGFLCRENNAPDFWYSVSATYYASSKLWMIGLLFATSVLFLCYRGYDRIDDIITTISSLSAFGVIAFPCATSSAPDKVGLFMLPVDISHIIHCVCAAVLFTSFFVMIAFRFTKTSGRITKEKRIRNYIYFASSYGILIGMVLQMISSAIHEPRMTIVNETIMLTSFGIAWLTKGEVFGFVNDKKNPQMPIEY